MDPCRIMEESSSMTQERDMEDAPASSRAVTAGFRFRLKDPVTLEFLTDTIFDLTGWPADTLLKYKDILANLFAEGSQDRLLDTLEGCLASGQPKTASLSILDAKGFRRDLRVTAMPSIGAAAQERLVDGFLSAMPAAVDADIRLEDLSHGLPGAAYRCALDDDFTIHYMSEGIADLTGFSAAGFNAGRMSFDDITHPDDIARIDSESDAAIEENRPLRLEYRLRHRDGHDV